MKYAYAFVFAALSLITGIHSSTVTASDMGDTSRTGAFKITLSTDNDTLRSGKPVRVKVTVTNMSGEILTLVRNAVQDRGGFDYKFDVRNDGKGSAARETRFHRALKGRDDVAFRTDETPDGGSLVFSEMKAGESVTDLVDLSRLYDLTEPGKYLVVATRVNRESGGAVRSNSITITVTQ